MRARLREGFAAWRRLGPVRGTGRALTLAGRRARAPFTRLTLRLRPPHVDPQELAAALGSDAAPAVLRATVRAALPTVARFERDLIEASSSERDSILEVARRAAEHRFNFLGSGLTDLSSQIDWCRDFKGNRRWPLAHISRLPTSYPDGSDIKVPWELSRFQHLPVLAAAFRLTGERLYLDEIGAQLETWIGGNRVEFGPNWACTMDVAIRASNWVAALMLCAEQAAEEPWFPKVLESLLLHGRFIRRHLEHGEARGNHYLSDVVGLLPVAALFSSGNEGRAWARWATGELVSEMAHQVREDGCDHEASIPYHRLVCELFLCGTQAADALVPGALPEWYRERLDKMLQFVCDYTRPDGLAPQIGDADDGRFLPLGDYGRADPRSHLHLFRQAVRRYEPAVEHAAYPEGGYWIMRDGDLCAIVRCGDVGVHGVGSHAHNDQLSFELCAGRQPMVIDPGAYLYTADPEARVMFRSTGFHSTLRVAEEEQNPLSTETLFQLEDRSRAEALEWNAEPGRARLTARHHGYERLAEPATHTRELRFDGPERALTIRDTVTGEGRQLLEWTFPLAQCDVRGGTSRAVAEFERGRLEISAGGLEFSVEDGWYSPSYGVRVPTPFVRARRRKQPGDDVTEIVLRVDGETGP